MQVALEFYYKSKRQHTIPKKVNIIKNITN